MYTLSLIPVSLHTALVEEPLPLYRHTGSPLEVYPHTGFRVMKFLEDLLQWSLLSYVWCKYHRDYRYYFNQYMMWE